MERSLAALVTKLDAGFGDRLISVILYGSAASGEYNGQFSDLNVLCVLTRVTPEELALAEPVVRWWRDAGNPPPLLMAEAEVRASADCFAIEFSEMRERRKLLHGKDVIADLAVDRRFYRAQVEHELRSKLLRLRQRAAAAWSDRDALLGLCLDSVSTFCVLGRHALALAGEPLTSSRRDTVDRLARALGEDLPAFHQLLDIRERKTAPQEADPATLFRKYLGSIEAVVRYVDGL